MISTQIVTIEVVLALSFLPLTIETARHWGDCVKTKRQCIFCKKENITLDYQEKITDLLLQNCPLERQFFSEFEMGTFQSLRWVLFRVWDGYFTEFEMGTFQSLRWVLYRVWDEYFSEFEMGTFQSLIWVLFRVWDGYFCCKSSI